MAPLLIRRRCNILKKELLYWITGNGKINIIFYLGLTSDAAEAAYLSGEYEKVDKHVQSIIQHSHSLIDSVKGYEIEIKKLIAQNKLIEAIKLGIQILSKLGC